MTDKPSEAAWCAARKANARIAEMTSDDDPERIIAEEYDTAISERTAELVEALEEIAEPGCQASGMSTCLGRHSERPCFPCIAQRGLNALARHKENPYGT